MRITERGLYPEIPEEEYHSDPVGNSLSSTMAKQILKSPAHLRHYLDAPRESKPEFDLGTAIHTLVLGTGTPLLDTGHTSWVPAEAKKDRVAAREEGFIPLKSQDYSMVNEAAEAVLRHEIAGPLFTGNGSAEVSAFGQHRSGVWLRGRFDWLTNGILVDLKSSRSADPEEFRRTAWTLGYDVQAAHYLETYRLATGNKPRGFIHVLVEKEPPYLVSVVQLDPEFLELGELRLERAIHRYRAALESGNWPGYPAMIHPVTPQAWMSYSEEEAQEKEEA